MEILIDYGVPLFILVAIAGFLYKEVWPLIKVKLVAEQDAATELRKTLRREREEREGYLKALTEISATQAKMQDTQAVITDSIGRISEQMVSTRELQQQNLNLLIYYLGQKEEEK